MTPELTPEEAEAMRLAFRQGMSQLAAAVHVVTTDGSAGIAGFTASAVCSVSDSPPTLLVCLNRSSSVATVFEQNRVLCVNTLTHQHEALSRAFGGTTSQTERFAAGKWVTAATGAPRLVDALVSFDCEVVNIVEAGSHWVLLSRIVDIAHGNADQAALVYFRRRYAAIL
ncbi:flavin reductase [Rhizobium oryzicola]|uniref:Flavin reductase n=1 Tax=Rhizobium oryzicola TaxID=1232668 RepID=A0ABT8SWB3_9HYPH|nr:flavin reductase [Rhizobium oryzicola]MDO1582737.1 flavin reductase [Rhizobium oryzicola]